MTDKVPLAFTYGRVSSSSQAEEDSTSLPDQQERTLYHVKAQKWEHGGHFEEDISGTTALQDRPEGSNLLAAVDAAVHEGRTVRVVTIKVDRFTRSLRNGANQLFEWSEQGVGYVSVEQQFDTASDMGKLFLNVLLTFAEFEASQIRSRNEAGRRRITQDEKYRDGNGHVWRWTGGNLPLGYTTDEKRIVIDPEHAETVRRIFELRCLRWSGPRIADQLNLEGRRTRAKGGTTKSYGSEIVMAVLDPSRRHYLGEGVERRLTKGEAPTVYAAPAILTPEVFRRATSAKAAPKVSVVPNAGGDSGYPWALATQIEHVHRDGSIHSMFRVALPSTDKHGRKIKRRWYRCSSSRGDNCDGLGIAQAKKMSGVSADYVEASVLRWILDQEPEDWQRQIEEAERIESADIDLQDARRELAKLERRSDGLHLQLADGDITKEKFADLIADTHAKIEALAEAIETEEARQAGVHTLRLGIADLLAMPIQWTPEGAEAQNDAVEAARNDLADNAARVLDTKPDAYGRIPILPDAVVEELRRMVAALGLRARVSASDNPRKPEVSVQFILTRNQGMESHLVVEITSSRSGSDR